MVKANLTTEMIEFGSDLIKGLDTSPLDIRAALWLYHSDTDYWRLVFATPAVVEDGPTKVYKKVQSTFKKLTKKPMLISLSDIAVVELDHPLVSILSIAIKTGPGISDIRFSNNTINGHVIDDAYIYRLTNTKNITQSDPCPCGSGKKFKQCHGLKGKMSNKPLKGTRKKKRAP